MDSSIKVWEFNSGNLLDSVKINSIPQKFYKLWYTFSEQQNEESADVVKKRIHSYLEYIKKEGDVDDDVFYFSYTIAEHIAGFNYRAVIAALEEEDIEARPIWKPMHLQPLYQEYEYFPTSDGDISKLIFENGLCLPSGTSLSENDQNRVIDIFLSLVS